MTTRWLLCLLAVLAVVLQAEGLSRRKRPHPDHDDPASFYYLVRQACEYRQWPETFCEEQGCSTQPPSEKWTIHGLWPNYDNAGYPTRCPGSPPFDDQDISGLMPRLRSEWPSYKGDYEQFWEHEYEQHGTCNINNLNEEAYFATTLDLNEKYPIEAALRSANIIPSKDHTFQTSMIQDVLENAWGARPIIKCSCPTWRKECDDGALIDSILLCIDEDLEAGDCTYDCRGEGCEDTNCEHVFYLPLVQHHRMLNTSAEVTAKVANV